jgi:hypothetical protein
MSNRIRALALALVGALLLASSCSTTVAGVATPNPVSAALAAVPPAEVLPPDDPSASCADRTLASADRLLAADDHALAFIAVYAELMTTQDRIDATTIETTNPQDLSDQLEGLAAVLKAVKEAARDSSDVADAEIATLLSIGKCVEINDNPLYQTARDMSEEADSMLRSSTSVTASLSQDAARSWLVDYGHWTAAYAAWQKARGR